MTIQFDTIALMGNYRARGVMESIRSLARHLSDQGATIVISADAGIEEAPGAIKLVASAQVTNGADLVIAVGGDGSMLHAARAAALAKHSVARRQSRPPGFSRGCQPKRES